MSSETDLIERAMDGSADAFCTLMTDHRDRLFRFLLTRCQNYADAEDALQDTFVNAFRYISTYNPKWRFSTWIYRIALRRLPRPVVTVYATNTNETPGNALDPLEACIRQSDRDNLWLIAKKNLNDSQFNTLWLHYAEDMSVNEVAHILEKSVSWTKVTLFRGRRRLATLLDVSMGIGSAAGGHATD